jgi:hypothetical protein
MRLALACAAFASIASIPVAQAGCSGSGCTRAYSYCVGRACTARIAIARPCPAPPAGWGHYLRQRLRDDCTAPLAIADELGGIALIRQRR